MSKVEWPYLNWHKIFRTDEYVKSLRMVNKKQLHFANQNAAAASLSSGGAAAPGPGGKPSKKHASILGSKQAAYASNPQMRNFT